MALNTTAIVEPCTQTIISSLVKQPIFWKLPPSRNPWLHAKIIFPLILLIMKAADFLLRKDIRQILYFTKLKYFRSTHRYGNVGRSEAWTGGRFFTFQHKVEFLVFFGQLKFDSFIGFVLLKEIGIERTCQARTWQGERYLKMSEKLMLK